MTFAIRRSLTAVVVLAMGLVVLRPSPVAAQSIATDGLLLDLDARVAASYPGTGATWFDRSPFGRDGTLSGSPLPGFDADERVITFPGGANGTSYVALGGNFRDFGTGITIEFEAEFGATLSDWEAILSFGNAVGASAATDDKFFIGQLRGEGELAIELHNDGALEGRCHTTSAGTVVVGDRVLHAWSITIGPDPTDPTEILCRIYRDGVELQTKVMDGSDPASFPDAYYASGVTNGSSFALPRLADREASFLGRNNFDFVNDFEGSIRYLRVYDRALSPAEVAANAAADPNAPVVTAVAVPDPMTIACDPAAPRPGDTVTCTVTGGDPDVELLWRATAGAPIASRGVRLDTSGSGTFSFTVPRDATGDLTIELVDWGVGTRVTIDGATAGPIPTLIPAGEGRGLPVTPSLALLMVVAALATALGRTRWRRWSTG